MIGYELQRHNMVESQVRPSDITDRRIIRAMGKVPRELFTVPELRATAYMDQDLAVSSGGRLASRRALLAPRLYATLVQCLDIPANASVLEVGAATGYGAAVLAAIAGRVVALECDAQLASRARATLGELGCTNVKVVEGPLAAGAPGDAPYDAILIAGSLPSVPPALLDQLKDGGRLAAVSSSHGVGQVTQWRRLGTAYDSRAIMQASCSALPGFERPAAFAF